MRLAPVVARAHVAINRHPRYPAGDRPRAEQFQSPLSGAVVGEFAGTVAFDGTTLVSSGEQDGFLIKLKP